MKIHARARAVSIDNRLGVNFPAERREALWAVQERAEKRRLFLAFKVLLGRLLGRGGSLDGSESARPLVREYAKVLTPAEIERFLGD